MGQSDFPFNCLSRHGSLHGFPKDRTTVLASLTLADMARNAPPYILSHRRIRMRYCRLASAILDRTRSTRSMIQASQP